MRNLKLYLTYTLFIMSFASNAQDKLSVLADKNHAIVQTIRGEVRGYTHDGIYIFKGIPYGKAERFMPAREPEKWNDVRSCLTYGPTCPTNLAPELSEEFEFALQRNRGYHVDENCLNLNIWTKQINAGAKKPVMIWLHGGGFSSGSAIEFPSQDGENLVKKGDVVVVSLNHRLNVLGFLDLSAYGEKYRHSANIGLTDMVLALNWVKNNVAGFGGDPDNVTIFGQSGGGAKVTCLMNMPVAKGLFHKAIVQSGSDLNHYIGKEIAQSVSSALLNELKLRPEQADSLVTINYERLAEAGKAALEKVQKTLSPGEMPTFGLEWAPSLDDDLLPFQPDNPAAMAISTNIPLLVGSVKNEFNPFIPRDRNISLAQAIVALEKKFGDKTAAYIAALKKAYPETKKPSEYLDLDMIFRPMVVKHANRKAAPGNAPVFTYLFTWQSPVLNGEFMAMHCMDLPFVFNNIGRCPEMTGGGRDAYVLAEKMSEAWIQFAKTGNPNHKVLPGWPAFSPENGATMIFDNTCIVKHHHDAELLRIRQVD